MRANSKKMRIHFIAIGGAAMNNLAIALHKKGEQVTGSDDKIVEPSKSNLKRYGLLPEKMGWDDSKINTSIDAVILGMHALENNPELVKAQELGLKIYSYPEFLFEQTKNKKRVVLAGSHGKTTITSMVMHVLKYHNIDFDYMVGAKLDGFETMVSLKEETEIAVFEGDEYLSSPIDRRSKFLHYKPDIALMSGIAWDHINVFPTFEGYVQQFKALMDIISSDGSLVYFEEDEHIQSLLKENEYPFKKLPYREHANTIESLKTFLLKDGEKLPLHIFGKHNLQNLSGAKLVLNELGISDKQFYDAIIHFKGAARRLQVLAQNEHSILFQDFAHAPSKLHATVESVKAQFPERKLIACMELHTFSSLDENFMKLYEGSMNKADLPIVYYNLDTIKNKNLKEFTKDFVKQCFNNEEVIIYSEIEELEKLLNGTTFENTNLLMMSSGNFANLDFEKLKLKF